ncbi:MAG: [FeFe] hydrogenase H-cluster radical SAM maturase HydE [Planctomycetota bacterium]|nr:MAG: [FeFe] hydrogenase H-cluster radical SAM maturase HydE [Planctomycetota bacterium]
MLDDGMTKREIEGRLREADGARLKELWRVADETRRRYVGDEIHLRGIIEFSNYCRRNCAYCGLRASNNGLRRYRMTEGEIVSAARAGAALGVKTVVLQSGEDVHYDARRMCEIIRGVKAECDVAVTLSIGERPFSDYDAMRAAGADRFLLKHETANRRLFAELHPDDDFDERIACLKELRDLGYQTGSGNIVGLPGQTTGDLADDILLFRALDVDMVGIGPFVAHSRTPLAGYSGGSSELTLRVIALTRIVLKDAHIPATTALATSDPAGRYKALQCGANVIMPNITPTKYRALYEIYPGKAGSLETPEGNIARIRRMTESLNRPISTGYGHTLKRAVGTPPGR